MISKKAKDIRRGDKFKQNGHWYKATSVVVFNEEIHIGTATKSGRYAQDFMIMTGE